MILHRRRSSLRQRKAQAISLRSTPDLALRACTRSRPRSVRRTASRHRTSCGLLGGCDCSGSATGSDSDMGRSRMVGSVSHQRIQIRTILICLMNGISVEYNQDYRQPRSQPSQSLHDFHAALYTTGGLLGNPCGVRHCYTTQSKLCGYAAVAHEQPVLRPQSPKIVHPLPCQPQNLVILFQTHMKCIHVIPQAHLGKQNGCHGKKIRVSVIIKHQASRSM